jgi:hypothetical protein
MVKDPVRSTLTFSNVSLVILIMMELVAPFLFLPANPVSFSAACCLLIGGLMVFFILGIFLTAYMFSTMNSVSSLRNTSTAAGIFLLIGLLSIFGGGPIFIFFLLASFYIYIFPLVKEKGMIPFVGSILSFVFGSTGLIIPIVLSGFVNEVFVFITLIFMVILLVVSHGLHIYVNSMALEKWKEIQFTTEEKKERRASGIKIKPSAENEPATTWDQVNREKEKTYIAPLERYDSIDEIPQTRDDVYTAEKRAFKPRELKPPPGFSFPVDD